MAYPRHLLSRHHKFLRRVTAANAITSTSWVALASDGTFDLKLKNAQVGDVIEASISGAFSSEAVDKFLDVATYDSGVVSHFIASATTGTAGPWFGPSGAITSLSGSVFYTLTAPDIATDKTVTCRVMARGSSTTSWTPYCDSDDPLFFSIKNLGPAGS